MYILYEVHLSIEWIWKIIPFYSHDSTEYYSEYMYYMVSFFPSPVCGIFILVYLLMHYEDEKKSYIWMSLKISICILLELKHDLNLSGNTMFGTVFCLVPHHFFLLVPSRKFLFDNFYFVQKVPASAIDHKMQRAQFVELLVLQSKPEQGFSIWKSYFHHPLFCSVFLNHIFA